MNCDGGGRMAGSRTPSLAPASQTVPRTIHAATNPPNDFQRRTRRPDAPSTEGGAGPRQTLRLDASPISGHAELGSILDSRIEDAVDDVALEVAEVDQVADALVQALDGGRIENRLRRLSLEAFAKNRLRHLVNRLQLGQRFFDVGIAKLCRLVEHVQVRLELAPVFLQVALLDVDYAVRRLGPPHLVGVVEVGAVGERDHGRAVWLRERGD